MDFYIMAGIAAYALYKSQIVVDRANPANKPASGLYSFTPAFYRDEAIERQNKEAIQPGMRGRTLLRRRQPK